MSNYSTFDPNCTVHSCLDSHHVQYKMSEFLQFAQCLVSALETVLGHICDKQEQCPVENIAILNTVGLGSIQER